MFRVYSCDCVGFEITTESGDRQAWCVSPCDSPTGDERDFPTLYIRSGLLEKESVPLDPQRTVTLLTAMARTLQDGHKFAALQRVLGIG